MITSPLIITSPVRRSGTTLLQRLLTSDPNTLIFGESCSNDFQMFMNFYISKTLILNQSLEMRNEQLDTVLAGNVNDWIPDLMPEIGGYLENMKESFLKILNHYSDFAKTQNRPNWGMKLPEWAPTNLILVEQFYPDFKTIYITRNIEDCIRSAKKVQMVNGIEEVEYYCRTWQENKLNAQQHLKPENTMFISYESFVENPQPIIDELKEFTGIKEIDASVMDFKFNTFKVKIDKNETLGTYTDPAELTEEELSILKKYQND